MANNFPEANDDCTRLSNRSCKTKLHSDSVSYLNPPGKRKYKIGLKLRLTKSQKELEQIEGVKELEAIEVEWEKKEARTRKLSFQKDDPPKQQVHHQRE